MASIRVFGVMPVWPVKVGPQCSNGPQFMVVMRGKIGGYIGIMEKKTETTGIIGVIWVVVKIMASFRIPIIIRPLIFRVPQKGPIILTTTHIGVLQTAPRIAARSATLAKPYMPQTWFNSKAAACQVPSYVESSKLYKPQTNGLRTMVWG